MLRSMSELEGYAIRATDGLIGHITDLYFDDERWVVRYFVVETGSWLASRKVLISAFAVGEPDWSARTMPVSITREQVRNSPDIDTDQPVSRQHEMHYLRHFGFPYYWIGAGFWGSGAFPGAMLTGVGYDGSGADYLAEQASAASAQREPGDRRLRSGRALLRYHIEATDGGMGPVKGLLVDADSWAVRYVIVDTRNWWAGHQVLIAPRWIQEISWPDATMTVNVTRQAVQDAPPYDPATPLTRDLEVGIYRHHRRTGYWADEVNLEHPQRLPVPARAPGSPRNP